MSLLNGVASFGSGLAGVAGSAMQDDATRAFRAGLMNSTPAAAPTATPSQDTDQPAPTGTLTGQALPGPRMPQGVNPYSGPHAAALWQAEQAIIGPESGSKANAQNPVSSAGGLFPNHQCDVGCRSAEDQLTGSILGC